jgi:hypothetical protein
MADDKLHPPQWLGRPVLSHEHVQDLETRAAINEFHHKMPRGEAEQHAHEDYVKENRERAAAHHLAGMKAAMATGNHQDARKHWALYDLHLKGLGKDSIGAVPPEIEKRMMDEGSQKPVYKFKAHKGDLYALHQPSKDVAPPEGEPVKKSDKVLDFKAAREAKLNQQAIHQIRNVPGPKAPPKSFNETGKPCLRIHEHGNWTLCGAQTEKTHSEHLGEGNPSIRHMQTDKFCDKCVEHLRGTMQKSEAKQCKWRLGERRCQRMVTSGYCHDHKDHWANKIKQKEAQVEQPLDKGALPTVAPAIAPLAAPKQPATLPTVAPKIAPVTAAPATGTAHLKAPAPATPQLHSTVEGFVKGFKSLPQGPERGKFLTQHLNHPPLVAALQAHPQGKQIMETANKLLNSRANAGFQAGKTVAVAKAEAREAAIKLLKGIAELAKGQLLKFPGNPAPAVDQGQAAAVQPIKPVPPKGVDWSNMTQHVGNVLGGECGARALDDGEDYEATRDALAHHFGLHPDIIHQELQNHTSRAMDDDEDLGHVTLAMSNHLRNHYGLTKPTTPKK